MSSESAPQAFRPVPRTGVIFVTTEAPKRGFDPADPDWCNLGQGQPETGALPGAPPRVQAVAIDPDDQEYAPVAGLWELREAVAALYNRLYRRGMPSQYTAENVGVSGGGRASLTRAAASLGQINLGHFLPDYTAYEELLDIFRRSPPIPILLDRERGYSFGAEDAAARDPRARALGAAALEPLQPDGQAGRGRRSWQTGSASARELDCALLIDEFYSHYVWTGDAGAPASVSAARYVEDVDRDPVVIFDGLTKNWRYPGWRVTWTLGPRAGHRCRGERRLLPRRRRLAPLQRAAVPLLEPSIVRARRAAIRDAFRAKRELHAAPGLEGMGVRIDRAPEGTFYVWGSVREPARRRSTTAWRFFRAALEQQGDQRSRRVLRRQPRQAPARAGLAVP